MMSRLVLRRFLCLSLIGLLSGCTTWPTHLPSKPGGVAQLTPVTQSYRDLLNLPEPLGRITVAVYGVRDQTGQYKPAPESNFSTAVTQGASPMLVKVLRDSKWFLPVERESLQNLLTERKLIRALEQPSAPVVPQVQKAVAGSAEHTAPADGKSAAQSAPPSAHTPSPASTLQQLIPANLIIEGGIVGYESNVRTGGAGAKYFGTGFSSQYRVDQVTVSLRVVNVRTGEILASVMTTKTIYSQEVQPSVYRFLSFQHLLEAEMGYSTNEPTELCIQEALESAVVHLIIQGAQDKLWSFKNPDDINKPLVQRYVQARSTQLLPADPDDANRLSYRPVTQDN